MCIKIYFWVYTLRWVCINMYLIDSGGLVWVCFRWVCMNMYLIYSGSLVWVCLGLVCMNMYLIDSGGLVWVCLGWVCMNIYLIDSGGLVWVCGRQETEEGANHWSPGETADPTDTWGGHPVDCRGNRPVRHEGQDCSSAACQGQGMSSLLLNPIKMLTLFLYVSKNLGWVCQNYILCRKWEIWWKCSYRHRSCIWRL